MKKYTLLTIMALLSFIPFQSNAQTVDNEVYNESNIVDVDNLPDEELTYEEEYWTTECDAYCEAEQWVIENYVDMEIWNEDQTDEFWYEFWADIAVLTEMRLNNKI